MKDTAGYEKQFSDQSFIHIPGIMDAKDVSGVRALLNRLYEQGESGTGGLRLRSLTSSLLFQYPDIYTFTIRPWIVGALKEILEPNYMMFGNVVSSRNQFPTSCKFGSVG